MNGAPARAQSMTVSVEKEKGVQRRDQQELHNGCSHSWSKVRE